MSNPFFCESNGRRQAHAQYAAAYTVPRACQGEISGYRDEDWWSECCSWEFWGFF